MIFEKMAIKSSKAPKALGPYSQGVKLMGNCPLLFISGQIPLDPDNHQMVTGDIRVQTKRAINNLEAVLLEAGSSLNQVLRVDIFLTDLKDDFQAMNEEYSHRFCGEVPPARQTVEVSALPLGAKIELSCIAVGGETDV